MIHHAYIIEDKEYAFDFAKKNAPIYDIHHIVPEKSSISVEQIRNLNSEIYIKPDSDRKIYIIEASNITIQAQNALLKTLEDPPKYATIILIGKRFNFLSTVISRCVYLPFLEAFPIIDDEIISFLNVFEKADLSEVFDHYKFFEDNKERIEEVLDELQLFFREKLLSGESLMSNVNKILEIQKVKENLRKNSNFQITIENMLIKLRRL